MIFTLHRYIFRELFKVFVLAAVALTLILSLGSVLRPVQEYGVGPRQVVHLIGYFLPIALTFVLPMAALFAGALVYGRFASDNELDACRASGVSLLTLIYPGLVLATIIAIANLILSFHVMPVFVHRAEKSLKADAKQILFRNINRRGYYKLPPDNEYIIYADRADQENNTLLGVVVAEAKADRIKKIITAERAQLKFSADEKYDEVQQVQVIVHNTYQVGPDEEDGVSFEWGSFTADFGSLLGDDIKFKKIVEMKRIQQDLMRFYPIAKLARQTYAQFITELLAQDIATKMAEDANSFYKLHSGEKLIEFTAGSVVPDEKKVQLSGEVVVVEYDVVSKERLCTLRSTRALLAIEGDELAPTLTMDMYNPTLERADGSEDLKMRHVIRGLIPPEAVRSRFRTGDVLDDIRPEAVSSALDGKQGPELAALESKLQREIRKTLADIEGEIHSRLVFGIGCISMILIGIGLGIIQKGGHLLSAFGASCVPAGGLIVCIMSGKHITENLGSQSISGIVVMWAGLVLLSLLAVAIYHRLLKY